MNTQVDEAMGLENIMKCKVEVNQLQHQYEQRQQELVQCDKDVDLWKLKSEFLVE